MNTRASKSFAIWATVLALVVALAALAVAGCNSDTTDESTTTTAADDSNTTGPSVTDSTGDTTVGPADQPISTVATLALTEADNSKSFTVHVGDTISVVLAGNPTTGYSWESALADEATALLTLVGEPAFAQDKVGANVVGSGGKYTFTFSAAAAGQVELKLKYWRPFEAQAEPLQTFSASITIQ
jgi:predicted secreted protein